MPKFQPNDSCETMRLGLQPGDFLFVLLSCLILPDNFVQVRNKNGSSKKKKKLRFVGFGHTHCVG